ncbi:MAG: NUDIX domain-containing protein [Gammaproteobacteria bacterium]|nr:MAG: NUDIX domain-containing protein [Gammaproteobacteria bacterium]
MKSEIKYRGRIIDVTLDEVELPNGERCTLDVVHHPGGSAIVALDADHRVCLLRQYRHVARDWLWELPAGKRDHNENPLATAKRELKEETGCEAASWEMLGKIWSSPGVFNEEITLYIAKNLDYSCTGHEMGEVMEVHWFSLQQVREMVHAHAITDAKTLIGLSFLST